MPCNRPSKVLTTVIRGSILNPRWWNDHKSLQVITDCTRTILLDQFPQAVYKQAHTYMILECRCRTLILPFPWATSGDSPQLRISAINKTIPCRTPQLGRFKIRLVCIKFYSLSHSPGVVWDNMASSEQLSDDIWNLVCEMTRFTHYHSKAHIVSTKAFLMSACTPEPSTRLFSDIHLHASLPSPLTVSNTCRRRDHAPIICSPLVHSTMLFVERAFFV